MLRAVAEYWLAGDDTTLDGARRQTDQALADQCGDTTGEVSVLQYLPVAIRHWRETGHLEVTHSSPDEDFRRLARWFSHLRGGRRVSAWAMQALAVMGMRLLSVDTTGVPPMRAELAGRLLGAARAGRRGDATARAVAAGQARRALAPRAGDGPDVGMLRAVAEYCRAESWRRFSAG